MNYLEEYKGGSGVFIQIGSGAGDLDSRSGYRDGFTEFVKKIPRERIKRIILVEPNPINIPFLRECWKDFPEAEIFELAIIPKLMNVSTIDLFYCPDDKPHYQVASINKNHVQKHYGENCALEKFIIKACPIDDFIQKNIDTKIELLSLDIEGIDYEIIMEIDFNTFRVNFFSFEYIHIKDIDSVYHKLHNAGFSFIGKGVDHNGYDYLFSRDS